MLQRGSVERISLKKIQAGATATDAGHSMFPVVSGNSSKADLCLTLPGSQDMPGNVSPSLPVALNTLYSKL